MFCSIGVEKCLNVFYQLELFKEMKEFITDLKLDDRSYDKVIRSVMCVIDNLKTNLE